MIRGRLVAVNGRPVTPEDYADDRARRMVDREFNLSHSAAKPAQNLVVAGRWVDEEAGASTASVMRRGVQVGEGATREVAAFLLDRDGFAGVPPTVLVRVYSKLWRVRGGGDDNRVDAHDEADEMDEGR